MPANDFITPTSNGNGLKQTPFAELAALGIQPTEGEPEVAPSIKTITVETVRLDVNGAVEDPKEDSNEDPSDGTEEAEEKERPSRKGAKGKTEDPNNPLEVKMEDGRIFSSLDAFEQSYGARLKNAENDEKKAELEAYKTAYEEKYKGKIEVIKEKAEEAIQSLSKAVNFRDKDGKSGIFDICGPFVERNLLTIVYKRNSREVEKFVAEKTWVKKLAQTANDRMHFVENMRKRDKNRKIYDAIKREGGYHWGDRGGRDQYAFHFDLKEDEMRGEEMVIITDLIVVKGKAPFKKGDKIPAKNETVDWAVEIRGQKKESQESSDK